MAIAVAVLTVALVQREPTATDRVAATQCATGLDVISASSYLPVLNEVAAALANGPNCVRLDVRPIDGRAAAGSVHEIHADLWIPDDTAWTSTAPDAHLVEAPEAGAGTVLAHSPLYLVSDPATAKQVSAAGGGWKAVVDLARGGPGGVRLALSEPAGSGDGLLAAGALGEAVWKHAGMDASAAALSSAATVTRTVPTGSAVLPPRPGEVNLVTEHALLSALERVDRASLTVLAPRDWTAALRYTFLPTRDAVADPVRRGALDRLLGALTGAEADPGLATAGLRRPDAGPPPGSPADLPSVTAPTFEVLAPHHVDHVFATWYAGDRRSDVLVAVDISGSMAAPAPGTNRPLIEVVGDGVSELAKLLPDDASMGLWEFGSRLDGRGDHRVLVKPADLGARQRAAVSAAVARLSPRQTGTGLHDTILAAYLSARDTARPGVPSHVVVFTDGRNQDDEPTLSLAQLAQQLTRAADPNHPVQLTVVSFGREPDAKVLAAALEPVKGYVDPISTAEQVRAAFLHAAAGGLHR